jgi:hypothetical protein
MFCGIVQTANKGSKQRAILHTTVSIASSIMPPKKKTRSASGETFGGSPCQLPTSDLPTNGDVARYFYLLKDHESDFSSQISLIENELRQIWANCNPRLPVIQKTSVHVKLRRFLDKVRLFDRKKNLKAAAQKVLVAKKDKLFDISACSCDLETFPCDSPLVRCSTVNCQTAHIICVCPPEHRIPAEERKYLRDQRAKTGTKGSYQMGSVDRLAAARDKARQKKEPRSGRRSQHLDEILANTNVSIEVCVAFNLYCSGNYLQMLSQCQLISRDK